MKFDFQVGSEIRSCFIESNIRNPIQYTYFFKKRFMCSGWTIEGANQTFPSRGLTYRGLGRVSELVFRVGSWRAFLHLLHFIDPW